MLTGEDCIRKRDYYNSKLEAGIRNSGQTDTPDLSGRDLYNWLSSQRKLRIVGSIMISPLVLFQGQLI